MIETADGNAPAQLRPAKMFHQRLQYLFQRHAVHRVGGCFSLIPIIL
jgi:hypothetical protein